MPTREPARCSRRRYYDPAQRAFRRQRRAQLFRRPLHRRRPGYRIAAIDDDRAAATRLRHRTARHAAAEAAPATFKNSLRFIAKLSHFLRYLSPIAPLTPLP